VNAFLDAVASWQTLALSCLIFGFAPGFVLRFVSLAYHRDDPRRREMRAELHAVPRIERPLWVAEQIELALCEGLWQRAYDFGWYHWITNRWLWRPKLMSGVERHRRWPDSFWIPSDEEKALITVGTEVKLMWEDRTGRGERMWVEVTSISPDGQLTGTLLNTPVWMRGMAPEASGSFRLEHVIDIMMDAALEPDRILD
jgi:hypothetical protein